MILLIIVGVPKTKTRAGKASEVVLRLLELGTEIGHPRGVHVDNGGLGQAFAVFRLHCLQLIHALDDSVIVSKAEAVALAFHDALLVCQRLHLLVDLRHATIRDLGGQSQRLHGVVNFLRALRCLFRRSTRRCQSLTDTADRLPCLLDRLSSCAELPGNLFHLGGHHAAGLQNGAVDLRDTRGGAFSRLFGGICHTLQRLFCSLCPGFYPGGVQRHTYFQFFDLRQLAHLSFHWPHGAP